jgi:hypothetical protein
MTFNFKNFFMLHFSLPTQLVFSVGLVTALLDDVIKAFRAGWHASVPHFDIQQLLQDSQGEVCLSIVLPIKLLLVRQLEDMGIAPEHMEQVNTGFETAQKNRDNAQALQLAALPFMHGGHTEAALKQALGALGIDRETAGQIILQATQHFLRKKLVQVGVDDHHTTELMGCVKALQANEAKLDALCIAIKPLMFGSCTLEALMQIVLALEIDDGNGGIVGNEADAMQKLATLISPPMQRKLESFGLKEGTTNLVVKAFGAVAHHVDDAESLFHAAMPLFSGNFHLEVFISVILALGIESTDGGKIDSKRKAVVELVRLAVPCLQQKLTSLGVAEAAIDMLAKAANTAADNQEQACSLCKAAMPIFQGDFEQGALVNVILALNIEDSDGKKIDTRERAVAELIKLAVPCADKALRTLGVHEEVLDRACKAAKAIADHPVKSQALCEACITVFQGNFDMEALLGIIEALEIVDSEGGKAVDTKEKAVLQLVKWAVPCMISKLMEAGMNADVVGKLTTKLTSVTDPVVDLKYAQQICKAAMPLLRGDLPQEALVNFVLALDIEGVDTKEMAVAEVVRLAVPCMEKWFASFGVKNGDIDRFVAAACAVAENDTYARGLCSAATKVLSGTITEASLINLALALRIRDPDGFLVESKEKAIEEMVRMSGPVLEFLLSRIGSSNSTDDSECQAGIRRLITELSCALDKLSFSRAQQVFKAGVPLATGKFSLPGLVAMLDALGVMTHEGAEINSADKAVAELAWLLSQCLKGKLKSLNMHSAEAGRLTSYLSKANTGGDAEAMLHAMMPMLRGDISTGTVVAFLLALNIKSQKHTGAEQAVTNKDEAVLELLQLAAPCLSNCIGLLGMDKPDQDRLTEAVSAMAQSGTADDASATLGALLPLLRGDINEDTLIGIFLALDVRGHDNCSIDTAEQAARELVWLAVPCITKILDKLEVPFGAKETVKEAMRKPLTDCRMEKALCAALVPIISGDTTKENENLVRACCILGIADAQSFVSSWSSPIAHTTVDITPTSTPGIRRRSQSWLTRTRKSGASELELSSLREPLLGGTSE